MCLDRSNSNRDTQTNKYSSKTFMSQDNKDCPCCGVSIPEAYYLQHILTARTCSEYIHLSCLETFEDNCDEAGLEPNKTRLIFDESSESIELSEDMAISEEIVSENSDIQSASDSEDFEEENNTEEISDLMEYLLG
eukprot:TRINITY_DN1205_c0_g2_i1.p2 TRINITY_DN1205_c0_g2~~TRINITY_DN1205_c0_g2_i1.p2  ORF type:complete len:136 (+),score=28.03 TRINITY_DN1205_c0_g2_i1:531-938(+)